MIPAALGRSVLRGCDFLLLSIQFNPCHPEAALFAAKDLPGYFRLECRFTVPRKTPAEEWETLTKSYASREIPSTALRTGSSSSLPRFAWSLVVRMTELELTVLNCNRNGSSTKSHSLSQ